MMEEGIDEYLASATLGAVGQLSRLPALLLGGCVGFAQLLLQGGLAVGRGFGTCKCSVRMRSDHCVRHRTATCAALNI
eukprot:COSAG05_NODE_1181_length_5596_cov_3.093687_3_plen_78_part_00